MPKKSFIISLLIVIAVIIACGKTTRKKEAGEEEAEKKNRTEKFDSQEPEESEEDEGDAEITTFIMYGAPFIIKNSDYALIPLRLAEINENIIEKLSREYFNSNDGSFTKSGSYNRFNSNDLYNIIFYNKTTGESYSLLNKKILINNFYLPSSYNPQSRDTSGVPFILYTLIEKDLNDDGKIDSDDGETVYKSDIYGQNKVQLTKDDVKLMSWKYDPDSGIIFLIINEDSDNDKKYTNKDIVSIFKTSISDSTMAVPVINDSLKTEMEKLYH